MLPGPEVAQAQMAAAQEAATPTGEGEGPGPNLPPPPGGAPGIKPGKEQVPREFRRFHGSVKMNPIRLGRDASRIGEEIVQHLAGIVGANVEITLEIRCELPEAATDKLVRDVTENCHTLGFSSYGFEEA